MRKIDVLEEVPQKECVVHRGQVKSDIISIFDSNDVFTPHMLFKIISFMGNMENGVGIGVTREIITMFFDEFFSSCCIGSEEKVPCLRHDMQEKNGLL